MFFEFIIYIGIYTCIMQVDVCIYMCMYNHEYDALYVQLADALYVQLLKKIRIHIYIYIYLYIYI